MKQSRRTGIPQHEHTNLDALEKALEHQAQVIGEQNKQLAALDVVVNAQTEHVSHLNMRISSQTAIISRLERKLARVKEALSE